MPDQMAENDILIWSTPKLISNVLWGHYSNMYSIMVTFTLHSNLYEK